MEWLTIIAIAVGPFLGIWANGKLKDRTKSTYQRKLDIFKTLMATRATPLARTHVESLNRIDIEFTGIKEKKVREAWAELLDHYEQVPTPLNPPLPNQSDEAQETYGVDLQEFNSKNYIWGEKTTELRSTLLQEMGNLLGYEFTAVMIKKAIYYPNCMEILIMSSCYYWHPPIASSLDNVHYTSRLGVILSILAGLRRLGHSRRLRADQRHRIG